MTKQQEEAIINALERISKAVEQIAKATKPETKKDN